MFKSNHFDVLPDNPFTLDMKRFINTELGRANQLGDGAPLVWLNRNHCWRNAEVRRADFVGNALTFSPVADPAQGDVLMIPRSATDLNACRQEFFRVLTAAELFSRD